MANPNLRFKKVAAYPTADVTQGDVIFCTGDHTIYVATGATTKEAFYGGNVKNVTLNSAKDKLTFTFMDGTADLTVDFSTFNSTLTSLQTQVTSAKNAADAAQKAADAAVQGVAADDKILSEDSSNKISADVSLAYDSSDKKLYLYGKDKSATSKAISSIDCTGFVKDGMLKGSALFKATAATGSVTIGGTAYSLSGLTSGKTYIVLVWNDDAETDPMTIDVSSLIDTYTGGNGITVSNNAISIDTAVTATKASVDALGSKKIQGTAISAITDSGLTLDGSNVKVTGTAATLPTSYSAPASGDSIDTAVAKLAKGVSEARSASGVTSIGGLSGAVTLDTSASATGAVKFTVDTTNSKITASVQGLSNFATAAQGAKADTSVQYSDASGNVTIAGKLTAAGVTGIATPTANSDAANKEYVDGKFTWASF